MKKPDFEIGKYRVVRACCMSGNCFECRGCFVKKRRKVKVQTDGVSLPWARYVAGNWASYDAKVERMK